MSRLYGGIDLHSNNCVVVLSPGNDEVVYRKRLDNNLPGILAALAPYSTDIEGLVVESTYNWYWLVDGLQEAGYRVHLANTAAIQQYEGLKYGDDDSDSCWLAKMLWMNVLPVGYIYPKEERPVRDLMRKRGHLVRQRTSQVLSIQNLFARNTGQRLSGDAIKSLTDEDVCGMLPNEELSLAIRSSAAVMRSLNEQVKILEQAIKGRVRLRAEYKGLLSVSGIGNVLALTIMLETGEIGRFARVGDFASYARCVGSTRRSNGKSKGTGNRKNGNKYLAWAFVEAANFAVRYDPLIKRYYQRKAAKTLPVVGYKAVAHKLARACYYILRDQVPFDVKRAFT